MLHWAQQFSIFCFLDNHDYNLQEHQWDCLLGAGAVESINGNNSSMKDIDTFLIGGDWVFGHVSYEALHAHHGILTFKNNGLEFPSFFFFKPAHTLRIKDGQLYINGPDSDAVFNEINKQTIPLSIAHNPPHIKASLTRDQYINVIQSLLSHIQRGDCYEINFCQEFFATDVLIDPLQVYLQLAEQAPNPYGAFYKLEDQYLLCASPERYLSKSGSTLISQPMKGTAPRHTNNEARDKIAKDDLQASQKEQSENVMVVDMVRNDLSRICTEVKVTELFGIQSFPYVHQMVSTVTGVLQPNVTFSDILAATFPMGSMTGAPKKRVMELIERYEPQKRGIFSGAVGYIAPDSDFDLAVVIRSIMYNAATNYLSYQVGSGITAYSQPEAEWEECLLKAAAIKKVLTG